jgi:hypothetical protein
MSALTDVFRATPEAVQSIDRNFGPGQAFDLVELPGADIVLLAQLRRALTGAEVTARDFQLVGEPDPEGPWLFVLPVTLADPLAVLDEPDVAAAARRWARAPEWAPRPVDGDALEAPLRALAALAHRAAAAGEALVLWWSP